MAYLPLSTANLPDPAIDPAQGASPADYFDIDTYTGTGATHERSNFTFQPDWLWIKRRSTADNHTSWDSVRGVNKVLKPNEAGAEGTDATQISSFDADGFTISGGDVNASGQTFVAWCWKAGTSVSGTTTGSGTLKSYTGSVNTTSGFSIIAYEGNATAGHQIPHHLNSAPEMVIVKDRDAATNWGVGHIGINGGTNPWDYKLHLDLTNAQSDDVNVWNDTAPTSSVVTLGAGGIPNGNTVDYIMYCFHSVDGFSKFGSYVGNGSADGPFVYTGFRPAWVLIMCSSASANHPLADNARDTYNPAGTSLFPETTDSDNSKSGREIDFLSNGFKIRNGNGEKNSSGETYIYMAFAENPFKYSNAR